MLLITADRGLAGGYSANAIRAAESLGNLLRSEGKEVVSYIVGRKGISFYRFRSRPIAAEWGGFSESPTYQDARAIRDVLIERFLQPTSEGGVDEIHVVYTRFRNMMSQVPHALRFADLVEDSQAEPVSAMSAGQGQQQPAAEEAPQRPTGPVAQSRRALARRGARRIASALRRQPRLQRPLAVRGVRARGATASDENGDGQRRRPHRGVHPGGQHGPPGTDHSGDQ